MRAVATQADATAIKDAALEAASSVNSLYQMSHDFLEQKTKTHPYAVLGTAAGIGFILGGGLASRVAVALLSVGGRVLANQILETSFEDERSE
jgi:hypothetical protein